MTRNLSIVAATAIALTVPVAGSASAGTRTHVGGAQNIDWTFRGSNGADIWNVDQVVSVTQPARSTFWALTFTFSGSGEGGYTGLQKDGLRLDGTRADQAIFSLWGANASRNAHGRCGRFSGEGTGLSCRMDLTIRPGAHYRLRVWRLGADAGGQWWGAWIRSSHNGAEHHLGDLRVPAEGHTVINRVNNFSEYFGPQTACGAVPRSVAVFTQPAANSRGGGVYGLGSVYKEGSWTRGPCDGGYFARLGGPTPAIKLVNGGAR